MPSARLVYIRSLAEGLLAYLPKLLSAGVILLVGNIVARFLSRGVLIGAVNMNLQYARLLTLGVKWMVLVLTAAMALDHLQIGQKIVDIAFGNSLRRHRVFSCRLRWGWDRAIW